MNIPKHDDMFLAYVELCRKLRIRPRQLKDDIELEHEYIRLYDLIHADYITDIRNRAARVQYNLCR